MKNNKEKATHSLKNKIVSINFYYITVVQEAINTINTHSILPQHQLDQLKKLFTNKPSHIDQEIWERVCGELQTLELNNSIDHIHDITNKLSHTYEPLSENKKSYIINRTLEKIYAISNNFQLDPLNQHIIYSSEQRLKAIQNHSFSTLPIQVFKNSDKNYNSSDLAIHILEAAGVMYKYKAKKGLHKLKSLPENIQKQIGTPKHSMPFYRKMTSIALDLIQHPPYTDLQIQEMFENSNDYMQPCII